MFAPLLSLFSRHSSRRVPAIAGMPAAIAALLLFSAAPGVVGQGAGRMLYVVPVTTFVERTSGETVVTINDTSGSIAGVQGAINSVRSTNATIVIVVHLQKTATYSVTNAGLV